MCRACVGGPRRATRPRTPPWRTPTTTTTTTAADAPHCGAPPAPAPKPRRRGRSREQVGVREVLLVAEEVRGDEALAGAHDGGADDHGDDALACAVAQAAEQESRRHVAQARHLLPALLQRLDRVDRLRHNRADQRAQARAHGRGQRRGRRERAQRQAHAEADIADERGAKASEHPHAHRRLRGARRRRGAHLGARDLPDLQHLDGAVDERLRGAGERAGRERSSPLVLDGQVGVQPKRGPPKHHAHGHHARQARHRARIQAADVELQGDAGLQTRLADVQRVREGHLAHARDATEHELHVSVDCGSRRCSPGLRACGRAADAATAATGGSRTSERAPIRRAALTRDAFAARPAGATGAGAGRCVGPKGRCHAARARSARPGFRERGEGDGRPARATAAMRAVARSRP
mmetsp:Transcript_6712/g.23878  ORF Transcript_6712/g.23878 Transcript_6712/m.23878 type:complete len:408 (-) Transcript_6712:112-1335(-)